MGLVLHRDVTCIICIKSSIFVKYESDGRGYDNLDLKGFRDLMWELH